jgi:HlyD family secretion protein
MRSDLANPPERAIRRYLLAGAASLALLTGGVGGLAAMTELSGAIIAQGKLVVDSNVKKVQHPSGGVIGAINVHEGDKVKAGQVLVRLDETVTRANLAIVAKSVDELEARLARLEAERDGSSAVAFPNSLLTRGDDPAVTRTMQGEQSLFDLRRAAREGQKAQLRERITQINEQVAGLTEQRDAKRLEIDLINRELDGIRKLWESKLVSIERMTALERDAARLKGEHGQLTASIAEARGRGSEIELQVIQVDQDMRSEVASEIREIQGKLSEFVERKVAAEDQLKRIEIKSPQDGVVHELAVHTVGGVIQAGEPVMLIVPVSDDLTVEVRIAPQDIDQVAAGQAATVRLSAFNLRTTPELKGILVEVSADLTIDPKSGAGFYTGRVILPKEEVARLKDLALKPGMPAEVFFPTGMRTVLSYLIKPLDDQIDRAFREE